MSSNNKHVIMIPRGETSKCNLRRSIKSFSKKHHQMSLRCLETVPTKFKQLKDISSFQIQKNTQINELETKYNIYKNGSPNFFSYNVETHKANILKNNVKSLDFPFIDRVIKEIRNSQTKENGLNFRNFELYPNSIKDHISHKFKDFLSDKQQLKDFMEWLNENCSQIQQKSISESQKFQEKQIIISSGFSQIIQQLSRLSKTRSQIIKMLWNRQCQEMQKIVRHLTSKVIEIQKSHLVESTKIHQAYQQQIDRLKSQNKQLSEKLQRQTLLNLGYVNTFRMNRKLIKKQEFALKKILNTNQMLIKENISLIDINTELIANQHTRFIHDLYQSNLHTHKTIASESKDEINHHHMDQKYEKKPFQQVKTEEAKVILFQKLFNKSKKVKVSLKQKLNSVKNNLFQEMKESSLKEVKQSQLTEQQLQEKKSSLYTYLLQRFQQNPYEKLIIYDNFLQRDDHQFKTSEIETAIKKILDSKSVELYLKNQLNQSLD